MLLSRCWTTEKKTESWTVPPFTPQKIIMFKTYCLLAESQIIRYLIQATPHSKLVLTLPGIVNTKVTIQSYIIFPKDYFLEWSIEEQQTWTSYLALL